MGLKCHLVHCPVVHVSRDQIYHCPNVFIDIVAFGTVREVPGSGWLTSPGVWVDHVEEHGTALYEQCCSLDLEGTDKASGLVTRGRSLATFLFDQTEVDLSGLPHPTKPHRPPRRSQHPKAKLRFPVHPHMLRHACGYALANKGMDTRSLQAYLGHASITHTVRYTEMSPTRFKGIWQ